MNESDVRRGLQDVYGNKAWGQLASGDGGSLSGPGSGIRINKVRVNAIAQFSRRLRVQRIIDVGCGDCAWQKGIVDRLPDTTDYHGVDVAPLATKRAQARCVKCPRMTIHEPIDASSERGRSLMSRLAEGRVVLALVKEAIQHMPLENGVALLRNLQQAGVSYLAITHHDKSLFPDSGNKDVQAGEMYENNVFESPFLLKSPLADASKLISEKGDRRRMGNLLFFDLRAQSLPA